MNVRAMIEQLGDLKAFPIVRSGPVRENEMADPFAVSCSICCGSVDQRAKEMSGCGRITDPEGLVEERQRYCVPQLADKDERTFRDQPMLSTKPRVELSERRKYEYVIPELRWELWGGLDIDGFGVCILRRGHHWHTAAQKGNDSENNLESDSNQITPTNNRHP
jgi:hypothetical protein